MKFYYVLSRGFSSCSHVFKIICFVFFTEVDAEINFRNHGGGSTEFSHILTPQYLYKEMQLPAAIYHHCTAARRDRVIDTVTNLHLNPRTMWNIFQMAKNGSAFTYFPLQGKIIKNHYS